MKAKKGGGDRRQVQAKDQPLHAWSGKRLVVVAIPANPRIVLAEDGEGRRHIVDVGRNPLDFTQVVEKARRPLRRRYLGKEPTHELLRLRDVQHWLLMSRDYVELLEKEGRIRPFRKHKGAKAWYPKWQFSCEFVLPEQKHATAPRTVFIRRADALAWLGVPAAEFESWVRCGVIFAKRFFKHRSKAHYVVSEIKKNVLGLG